jgi:hypothetical protein
VIEAWRRPAVCFSRLAEGVCGDGWRGSPRTGQDRGSSRWKRVPILARGSHPHKERPEAEQHMGRTGRATSVCMTRCVGDEDGNAQLNAVGIAREAGEDACARRRSLCRREEAKSRLRSAELAVDPGFASFGWGKQMPGQGEEKWRGRRGSGGRRQAEQVVERLHAAKKVTHGHESGRTATHTLDYTDYTDYSVVAVADGLSAMMRTRRADLCLPSTMYGIHTAPMAIKNKSRSSTVAVP